MRILLLSDTYSEHTEKWAIGLANKGIKIGLFSFNKASYPWFNNHQNITLLYQANKKINADSNILSKLSYLKLVRKLRASIKIFKPTILHAHYATSYGLIGALSGFHPYVISAWGTDVMKFPQQNFINKAILKYNLHKSDAICATSATIQNYLLPVTSKKVTIIPFGVNITEFFKKEVTNLFDNTTFVIGSIKPLEELYNIHILIQSFSIIKLKYPTKNTKLLIIGEGSQETNLKKLVAILQLTNDVVFTGRIAFNQIPTYFNMLDVLVNISDYESFGVSVIEAMACEKPVIATNTGGLKEIIENSTFGSLVEVGNIEQTANELEKYLLDENLKQTVGIAARKKVIEKYNWADNVDQMILIYTNLTTTK